MANVYALIEYLPIGAAGAGAGGEAVLSEHPTWDGAIAAKQTLYNRRPELVGCLTIRVQPSKALTVVVEMDGREMAQAALPVEKEAGDAGGAADGPGGGDVGVQREAGRGGRRAPLPEVRPDAGVPAGPPVGGPVLPV